MINSLFIYFVSRTEAPGAEAERFHMAACWNEVATNFKGMFVMTDTGEYPAGGEKRSRFLKDFSGSGATSVALDTREFSSVNRACIAAEEREKPQ